jgi:hypothetical protein
VIRLDDAKKGDILYRHSSAPGNYYRPIKVIRTTPKQIIGRTLTGQELRFWKSDGFEVGSSCFYRISGGEPSEHYRLASCDQGREWPQ